MGIFKQLKKAVLSRIRRKQRVPTVEVTPPSRSGTNDNGPSPHEQDQDAAPGLAPTASQLSLPIAVSVERETIIHTEADSEPPKLSPSNLVPPDFAPPNHVLPNLAPPNLSPPSLVPPSLALPSLAPPNVESPIIESPIIESPNVEPSLTNNPEDATTPQTLDTQVVDTSPASDAAIVRNSIHPSIRRDSAVVHTSSVSTNKLPLSAFALLRRPTHLVGGAALVTVSSTPAEPPGSSPTAPTTSPHAQSPLDSPGDNLPITPPVPSEGHAIPAAEDNDNVFALHLNNSQATTVPYEPNAAPPEPASEDQAHDEPVEHIESLSDIGRTYNDLDPICNMGRKMPLGAGVYTIEGFADRDTEFTTLIGRDPNTKEKRWLKVICKYDVYRLGDPKERNRILLEKDIMQRAFNEKIPGLVRSLGSWSDKYFVYHWMDCPIGTLKDAIKHLLPHQFVFNRYVTELLLALNNLHDMGCIHRGISLETIFVQADGSLVLGDLTEVCRYDPASPPMEVSGFRGFMAPEIIAPSIFGAGKDGYDQSVDVWSLGMVFLHMYLRTLDSPYGKKPDTIEYRTFAWDPRQLAVMIQLFNHDRVLYDLLCQMLVRDPSQRSSVRRLLAHPYFELMQLDLNDLNRTFPMGGRFEPANSLPWEDAPRIQCKVSRKASEMILADEKERETHGDPYFFTPEVHALAIDTVSNVIPRL